jgi:cyclophilin family peptidyl-prolyl cis-trans isomerase
MCFSPRNLRLSVFGVFFLLNAGFLSAANSFLTNFSQGYYISPTSGAKLVTPLNQYFRIDPLANTNLLWVSTDTQYGGFLMELLPTNAPKTVANFLSYVRDGAYENTVVHRSTSVTNDGLAVIQTGGFTADPSLSSIPTFSPVTNEYGISNSVGTVAMAKVGGNPNSATDQWFINVSDNSTTLNSNNNGGFTVFGRILGKGMSNVINPISALQTYNISSYNSAFTETPLQGVTNGQPSLYLTNLVTITRIATLPCFAFSSDSDACPADIQTTGSATNLVTTFNHYPTNNPTAGIYITVAVTDTNGNSPKYHTYSTNGGIVTTNVFDGGNAGFYVIPSTLGSQKISFPQIGQQSLSNNITNLVTNTVNRVTNIATNISTSFTIPSFPTSSANVPVLLQILSGPIKVSANPTQTSGIQNGTAFTLTGTGTVTMKATTFGTGTNALVNYYYSPAALVTSSFVVKAYPQTISSFQTIFPPTYKNPPFQIQIPTSSSDLPVTVSVLSGPATFSQGSNIGTITITGAGPVTLAANQAGNVLYASAPQVTTSFTVARSPQSIAFPQSTTNLSVGQTVSLTATSSSSLPVSYSLVGGPATLTGGSLKISGPGTVSVVASQVGNSNYLAATPITNNYTTRSNQTISAFGIITNRPYSTNPQTIIVPSSTSKLPVVLSVKSGPASILTSNSISLTGIGTITLAADQSGNTNFFAAPQITKSFVVAKASQNLTPFAGLPAKLTNGMAPFTITIPSAFSGLTPVLLRASGAGFANNNSVTITNAGTLTLTATNAGNSNYLATSLTTNIPVALGNQSITFPGTNSACQVGLTYTLQATASSGLPVSYSLLPANTTNATLTGTNLFIRSFTTNRISVVTKQAGNSGYNAATNVTNFFTIIPNQGGESVGGSINTYYGSLTIGNGATWTSNSLITINGNANSTLLIGTNSYLFSNGVITLTANTNGGNSTLYQGHQLNYLGSTYTLDSNGALVLNSGISQLALSNAPSTNSTNNNTPPGGGPLPPGNVNFGP